MEFKWKSSATFAGDYNTMIMWKIFDCDNCYSPVAVKLAYMDGDYEIVESFPKYQSVHKSIPKKAQRYLLEAIETVYTPSSSILLCCSSIDSMLKEIGFKDGCLYSRIIEAAGQYKITESMKIWANKIRLDSNAIRHADESLPTLTIDDAKNTIEFTLALGEFLFVIPYKMKKTTKKHNKSL
jgi:hypothetical protein